MKKIAFWIPLWIAFIAFIVGLFMIIKHPFISIAIMIASALIMLGASILRIVIVKRKFKFSIRLILKIIITISSFILFTLGLGLLLVAKMIVLGLILATIGLASIFLLVPMFIAFVRANPFEHIIITPDYDDIDTEFFKEKKD